MAERSLPTGHVVHVVGTLGAGGVQRLILDLAASPALAGYRHSVICVFGASGDLAKKFEEAAIPAVSCGVPWPTSLDVGSYRVSRLLRRSLAWAFPFRFARELARLDADIVHTHLAHRIDLQADGALRRARVPMVWTIHGQYRPEGAELTRWRRAVRMASEAPAAITAVAENLAQDFRARGLDHAYGVPVTRGGIRISAFRQARARDRSFRERWKIPADAVVFGAHGRLVPEKAYEVFVRAAARRVGQGSDAHFVIAGGGPLKGALEEEIAKAGLKDRFHLVGFVDDVPGFLNELDVFVLSSRFEGFPIALVEALAAGKPCVATSLGGVEEMVGTDGALVVAPESEESLAEAMREMESPAVRAALGAKGPAIAERFSIDRMAEQFSAIYERLLDAGRSARGNTRRR
jgi:glycosyltransferase involved in cell wall biosynthesis